jgi:mediator of RNA polymerase II transcription subunit 7
MNFFQVQKILQNALQMLPDTSDFDSKHSVNIEGMEIDSDMNAEQHAVDPCSPSDRIMCKVIDDMLSNGLY